MNMFYELTKDPLFGMFLTSFLFVFYRKICNKFKISIVNPLILSIISIIIILKVTNIDYENYYEGAKIFNTLIVPATVALAVPLYKNFHLLEKYYKQILFSIGISTLILTILVGLITSALKIDTSILASILPKSVTTAIAIGVSEKMKGIQSITVVIVIISGNIGALFGPILFKLFNIHHPVAQGISLGATSHAVGTSKAIEMGEVQGSMSSLAIIITGIFVVVMAPIVYTLMIYLFY